MKILYIVLGLFFLNTFVIQTLPPLYDIPWELEDYHTDRMPQFLVDFYENVKETLSELKENITLIPQSIYETFIGQQPHHDEQAEVRFSNADDLGSEEKKFLSARLPHVKSSIEKMVGCALDEDRVPRIGLAFSGGGLRAMFSTLGFLCGAHDIGLLDSTLYCAGLSGSTWALAPWIATREPLKDFTYELTNKLEYGVDHIDDPYELSQLLEIIFTKVLCKQMISPMDIYGAILANTLLKGYVQKPLLVKLTESHSHILDGSFPMPIYTAIQSDLHPYEWMEFTPFEVGSSFLRAYTPTWAYGRKFKHGVSIDHAPEQTLGYVMGVCGSAFEVSLRDIMRISASNLCYYGEQLPSALHYPLKKLMRLIVNSFLGEVRLFPSMLNNFTYQYEKSMLFSEKTITLVDAGIDFNVPLPPLLRLARNLDLIIIYDTSSNIAGAPELIKAALYAKRKGLKFPAIDLDDIDKRYVSVFKDDNDSEVPVVIYIPRIKNLQYSPLFDPDHCIEFSYCNTFNFYYKPEEARLLCGFSSFALIEQQEIVKGVIKDILTTKYHYELAEIDSLFDQKYSASISLS